MPVMNSLVFLAMTAIATSDDNPCEKYGLERGGISLNPVHYQKKKKAGQNHHLVLLSSSEKT